MSTPFNMPLNQAPASAANDALLQATNWHAHFQSGEAVKADYEAFERWKNAHPDHASVYQKLSSLWSGVEAVDTQAGKATIQAMMPGKRKNPGRKTTSGLLGLAVVLFGTWLGMRSEYTQYYLADHRSKTGEQSHITLADHSAVLLDTHSAINVNFNPQARHIALIKGALFIDVAKDASRPLIVETDIGSAQALGTQFSVEKGFGKMTVSVKESHVKVCAKTKAAECVTLAPGEEVDVERDHLSPVRQIDPIAAFAWTKGDLIADNLPLDTVLERLNRYKTGKLSYDADALHGVRVSGVLKLTEVDQTLQHISQTVPIQIDSFTAYWTTVRTK